MKLAELEGRSPTTVATIQRIERSAITILYASDYFDGVISGLAELDGRELWYAMAEEVDEEEYIDWFRRYWLIELTSAQAAEQRAKHASFQKYVGKHFDFHSNGERNHSMIRPRNSWDRHYDKYPPEKADPTGMGNNDVVGWFEW